MKVNPTLMRIKIYSYPLLQKPQQSFNFCLKLKEDFQIRIYKTRKREHKANELGKKKQKQAI
jgi:hypothetical protein